MNQDAFSQVTLITSNILFTSTIAYVASEISNAHVLSKLRIFFNNGWFFIRAIVSTSIASIVDTTFMLPVIITHSSSKVAMVFYSLILVKLLYSIMLIPVLWILVEFLKRKENRLEENVFVPFSSVSYMSNLAENKFKS